MEIQRDTLEYNLFVIGIDAYVYDGVQSRPLVVNWV